MKLTCLCIFLDALLYFLTDIAFTHMYFLMILTKINKTFHP
jgi:hypothetical protein